MKLDKAIEILEFAILDKWTAPYQDYKDAIKLGIEAMKRIQDCRRSFLNSTMLPLPGETED